MRRFFLACAVALIFFVAWLLLTTLLGPIYDMGPEREMIGAISAVLAAALWAWRDYEPASEEG